MTATASTPTLTAKPPRRQARAPRAARRHATNLSLNVDVLEAAKALDINLSQVCDDYLRCLVWQEQARRWRSDHADYIAAYSATIEHEGLPLGPWQTY